MKIKIHSFKQLEDKNTLLEFGIRFCNAFIFSLILLLLLCPYINHIFHFNNLITKFQFHIIISSKKLKIVGLKPFLTYYEPLRPCSFWRTTFYFEFYCPMALPAPPDPSKFNKIKKFRPKSKQNKNQNEK